jgi:hypothetical protein
MKSRLPLVLVAAVILIAALFIAFKPGSPIPSLGHSSLTNTLGTKNASSGSQSTGSTSRSGAQRASADWRQKTLTKDELAAHPKYWMLAYSEEDKAWLERFNYPTMEEEARLEQSSVETLRSLAEAGDTRARTHLGVKLASKAMTSSDPNVFRDASLQIHQALVEGGPYEAARTSAFFVELGNNRRSFGDLNEAQVKGLQKELLFNYEIARGLSEAYQDAPAVRYFNPQRDIGRWFGLPKEDEMTFDYAMKRLSNMNRSRTNIGLAPMNFERRPPPPGSTGILDIQRSNMVFER